MHSRENEMIELEIPVMCTGGVENWLNTLLEVHQQSVGAVIALGLQMLSAPDFDILSLIEESILQVGRRRGSRRASFKSYLHSLAGFLVGVASSVDAGFRKGDDNVETRQDDNEADQSVVPGPFERSHRDNREGPREIRQGEVRGSHNDTRASKVANSRHLPPTSLRKPSLLQFAESAMLSGTYSTTCAVSGSEVYTTSSG